MRVCVIKVNPYPGCEQGLLRISECDYDPAKHELAYIEGEAPTPVVTPDPVTPEGSTPPGPTPGTDATTEGSDAVSTPTPDEGAGGEGKKHAGSSKAGKRGR